MGPVEPWSISAGIATAQLTAADLLAIHYAVSELRASVEEWEFETLVGAMPEDADQLLLRVKATLDELPSDEQ